MISLGISGWTGNAPLYAIRSFLQERLGVALEDLREGHGSRPRLLAENRLDGATLSSDALALNLPLLADTVRVVGLHARPRGEGTDRPVTCGDIHTVEGLYSARVAADRRSTEYGMLQRLFVKHGKERRKDIVDEPRERYAELLRTGRIDAAILAEPLYGQMLAEPGIQPVREVSVAEVVPFSCLVVRRDLAGAPMWRRLLSAHGEAARLLAKLDDRALELLVPPYVQGLDEPRRKLAETTFYALADEGAVQTEQEVGPDALADQLADVFDVLAPEEAFETRGPDAVAREMVEGAVPVVAVQAGWLGASEPAS